MNLNLKSFLKIFNLQPIEKKDFIIPPEYVTGGYDDNSAHVNFQKIPQILDKVSTKLVLKGDSTYASFDNLQWVKNETDFSLPPEETILRNLYESNKAFADAITFFNRGEKHEKTFIVSMQEISNKLKTSSLSEDDIQAGKDFLGTYSSRQEEFKFIRDNQQSILSKFDEMQDAFKSLGEMSVLSKYDKIALKAFLEDTDANNKRLASIMKHRAQFNSIYESITDIVNKHEHLQDFKPNPSRPKM